MSNSDGNRWLIGIAVILVIALVGAICVGAGAFFVLSQPSAQSPAASRVPVAPSNKNALRLPGGDDPTSLDPAKANDTVSVAYVDEIFSGLVTFDKDLKIAPDIAKSWEPSDGGKTYTFHLRDDVKFHDGRPVTAQDFKYSIERAANPATRSPTVLTYLGDIVGVTEKFSRKAAEVSGVQVVDNYTLKITIDQPKAYFLAKLTHPVAFVVDKNNVERGGTTWSDKPNGTGPFKLKEYVRAQRLILAKNESYFGDIKPQVDEVDFILAGGSVMNMYENGDLESAPISIRDFERVSDPASPLNKELYIGPSLSTWFIVFNVNKPPFDDPKVRQAIALAIDRQSIVDVVFRKMLPAANTILPPEMPGYAAPQNPSTYDPAKAKQLLAESKYAGKLPDITWTTSGAGGSAADYVAAIADMLNKNLGIKVSIQLTDSSTYLTTLDDPPNNPYQMFDIGWSADYVDPQDFIDVLYRTGSTQNWGNYSNPEVDKLVAQAGVEKDTPTRFKLYQQAEQMILADAAVVPLFYSREYWLTKPYVKGMFYPPLVIPRLKYVSLTK